MLANTIAKGRAWFTSKMLGHSSQSVPEGLCVISIHNQEVILAYARPQEKQTELQFIESLPFGNMQSFIEILSATVKQHQLTGAECVWILRPEQYELFLLDALPVPENEFQAAIRWKLKSMLHYPIDDLVVDHFPMPRQKTHDPHDMISVVAARISFLQEIVDKIKACGLRLTSIDIQELALRNITSLYENDSKTSVMIYLQEERSELIITREKTIYFQRQLDISLSQMTQTIHPDFDKEPHPYLDKAALDLQRSFDYYQSQWRQPAPARILLATTGFSATDIAKYLSYRLAMPFDVFDLQTVMPCPAGLSIELQGRNLPLIGGILREQGEQHATIN